LRGGVSRRSAAPGTRTTTRWRRPWSGCSRRRRSIVADRGRGSRASSSRRSSGARGTTAARLLEPLGYVPPAEFEKAYHDRQAAPVGLAVLT